MFPQSWPDWVMGNDQTQVTKDVDVTAVLCVSSISHRHSHCPTLLRLHISLLLYPRDVKTWLQKSDLSSSNWSLETNLGLKTGSTFSRILRRKSFISLCRKNMMVGHWLNEYKNKTKHVLNVVNISHVEWLKVVRKVQSETLHYWQQYDQLFFPDSGQPSSDSLVSSFFSAHDLYLHIKPVKVTEFDGV